jgi:hypothetical protein
MRDPNLSESLSQKGRDRAKGITWEAIAEQMVALARMVAQGGSA